MAEKRRYDRNFLDLFCRENDIKFENIDESIKITRDIHIKGTCIGENCIEKFDKSFRQMVETSGPFCTKCSLQNEKEKSKKTCLKKYGVANACQSDIVKDKIKKTNLEKYGNEYAIGSETVKDKIKETMLDRYGVVNPSLDLNTQCKRTNTFIERYGVNCIFKLNETKEKIKETCLEKYGVEHTLQVTEFREKGKEKCLKKYGTEYGCQSDIVKDKIKETNLKKYGVEYGLQNELVKEKGKKTSLKNYGVEYPMQNSSHADNVSKSAYKLKDYTFPSGKVIKCQGYEPYGLDILINDQKIEEDDIITSKKEVPEIWYKDSDDKNHRYYVDIFIKSLNKFIEVKSIWTYKKNKEKVEITKNTVKEKGFLYECWVFDGKGNIVETIR